MAQFKPQWNDIKTKIHCSLDGILMHKIIHKVSVIEHRVAL